MPIARHLLLPLLALVGCQDAQDDPRRPWLRDRLVRDNRAFLERAPRLAEGKLVKMASGVYPWFRGTLSVFHSDSVAPHPAATPTRYSTPKASRVLVLGDPHPENLGAFLAGDGTLLMEFNDFDACAFGPFHLDVRRLSLGFYVAGVAAGMSDEGRDAAARRVAAGYVEEIRALRSGAEGIRLRRQSGFGALVDDLLRRARRDGDDREKLDEYSQVEADGVRRMFYGIIDPQVTPGVYEDEVVEISFEERALVEAALAHYPHTLAPPTALRPFAPEMFALKGVSRRLGAGVSSYPTLRYYVLVEGPTEDPDDDWLLEMKEIGDPPAFPGLVRYPMRRFTTNGERVVLAQRTLQELADDDPLLGWADVAPLSFRVRHRNGYQKGVSVSRMTEKLAEGDWSEADIAELAFHAGRLLARGHALSPSLDADRGLEAIAEALGIPAGDPADMPLAPLAPSFTGPAGFVEETALFTTAYGPRVVADHALLIELLNSEGPRLGYQPGRGAVIR